MVSNQVLGTRVAAGLMVACATLAGCSHFRHHPAAPAPVIQRTSLTLIPVRGGRHASIPPSIRAHGLVHPRPTGVEDGL